MKKNKKNKMKNRHLLAVLSFLCICAIALTMTGVVDVGPARNAASIVLSPIQSGINTAGGWLTDKASMFRNVKKLSDKNEELQNRINELEEENTILSREQSELRRLRELYQLDGDYSQYEKIGAKVISKDPGIWFHNFVINRGSDDGIEPDMNVVSGSGLVGIVTDVGKNWASVRSIIDDASNVSGMTASTLDTCIVSGDLRLMDQNRMSFSQMTTENEISPGEKIVTSNISDKYLEGILIGYIDEVNDDSNHLTKTGYLIPAVDFAHLQEVLVIKAIKQTGGE